LSSSTPATDSQPAALDSRARSVLGITFLTLFIDLAGFSIIFPLFPSMLAYYREVEGHAGLFGWFLGLLDTLSGWAGPADREWGSLVLFGGVLGSLYSLLQFLCAPLFGALSDRVGRRPVLLVSLLGILLSYILWMFAGSFTLLVAARILGGIMSANISTASAIVADVTTTQTRSRGMAVIGMAFGLGFVCGPALGGIASLLDPTQHFPALVPYGLNPYSTPAAIAAALTLFNLVWVWFRLPETLRARDAAAPESTVRTINPLALFRTQQYPGVTRTNITYFLFLLAFSGMEFSLTFLAADRLGYSPAQNAGLFLFIGLILAGLQGTYVRRHAQRIGNRRMVLQGLVCIIPGLLLIGFAALARNSYLLFTGLFFLAAGAAQATPTLAALVSVYTPDDAQGRVLGVFRSLGALARAGGPLIACVLYWRLGASASYFIGAAFMLLPLLLARRLP
jgi:MFS family permease